MSSTASAEEGVGRRRSELIFWQLTVFIAIFLIISGQSICPVSQRSTCQWPWKPAQQEQSLSRLDVPLPQLRGIVCYWMQLPSNVQRVVSWSYLGHTHCFWARTIPTCMIYVFQTISVLERSYSISFCVFHTFIKTVGCEILLWISPSTICVWDASPGKGQSSTNLHRGILAGCWQEPLTKVPVQYMEEKKKSHNFFFLITQYRTQTS